MLELARSTKPVEKTQEMGPVPTAFEGREGEEYSFQVTLKLGSLDFHFLQYDRLHTLKNLPDWNS